MRKLNLIILIAGSLSSLSPAYAADEDPIQFHATAGAGIISEYQGSFVRVTGLIDVVDGFQMGLEGEAFAGLNTFKDSEITPSGRYVDEGKLSFSPAVYAVARLGSDQFGGHVRLGVRHYDLNFETTLDGELLSERDSSFEGIDVGIGANYQFDEDHKHGIRADIGISGLVDFGGDSYYPILGGAIIGQVGYSYKF